MTATRAPENDHRRPLTLPDAFLLNVAAAALIDPAPERVQFIGELEHIARILPRCTRDTVLLRDVCEAAERLVKYAPGQALAPVAADVNPWLRAQWDTRCALAVALRWRAAMAHQQLYPGDA